MAINLVEKLVVLASPVPEGDGYALPSDEEPGEQTVSETEKVLLQRHSRLPLEAREGIESALDIADQLLGRTSMYGARFSRAVTGVLKDLQEIYQGTSSKESGARVIMQRMMGFTRVNSHIEQPIFTRLSNIAVVTSDSAQKRLAAELPDRNQIWATLIDAVEAPTLHEARGKVDGVAQALSPDKVKEYESGGMEDKAVAVTVLKDNLTLIRGVLRRWRWQEGAKLGFLRSYRDHSREGVANIEEWLDSPPEDPEFASEHQKLLSSFEAKVHPWLTKVKLAEIG